MKSRLLATCVAVLAYAIIDGNAAKAERYFYINGGTSANWDSSNWCDSCANDNCTNTVPTEADAVTICPNETAVVNDLNAEALKVTLVAPTGGGHTRIEIDPSSSSENAVLTLGDSTTALESTLGDGTEIHLKSGPTYIARLVFIAASHTVSGSSGEIEGFANAAEIAIGDGLTFTSSTVINGRLKIMDDGAVNSSFMNSGKVIANSASGTLDLSTSTSIDDSSGDSASNERWQVTASGAFLRFLEAAAAMEGRVHVSSGTLRIGDDVGGDTIDVVTSGVLSHSAPGKIVVGVGDVFKAN